MRRLRLAADIPMRERCDEDFAAMPPVAGGRLCGRCERVVHDLSAMTRDEASRLLADRAGERTCVRFEVRGDGSLVFAPGGARGRLPVVAAAALAACTPWGLESEAPDDAVSVHDASVVVPEEEPVEGRWEDGVDDEPSRSPVQDAAPSAVRHPRAAVPRRVYTRSPRGVRITILGGAG